MPTTTPAQPVPPLSLPDAAKLPVDAVFERLATSAEGLGSAEAASRLQRFGPNALREHGTQPAAVLRRQLRNPMLILLVATALVSLILGEHTEAYIILGIIALSVGLGFVNEYRSERALEDLHAKVRHRTVVVRDGRSAAIDVTEVVPGDVVRVTIGDIVPADLRLIAAHDLECDESILTGESVPAAKSSDAPEAGAPPSDLSCCAYMGTTVKSGSASGVVVATGGATAFGAIALRLGERPPETAFEIGLRDFSSLLVRVTTVLTVSIFVVNAALNHPWLDSLLFSLAIAVGLTPQLLPAIVTVSLATGAQRLVKRSVVVKRLVSIEDLGNIEVLYTDKTGTLTTGSISYERAIDCAGRAADQVFTLGLLCNAAVVQNGSVVGGNPLDRALWEAAASRSAPLAGYAVLAEAPFDHERKLMSVLVTTPSGQRLVIAKGAPESIIARCPSVDRQARDVLTKLFAAGARVVALATRDGAGLTDLHPGDERDLQLQGFIAFSDPPKTDAAASLQRLRALGVDVKVVTGDNEHVAEKVCGDLGLAVQGVLVSAALDAMSDADLKEALPRTTIFARVTPEQKSRIIRLHRSLGKDVGFLGDGVNDAVALHDADVGISVDSATDVAKDAADIVLLDKSLSILADGVVEGRRIFSNTIKYVLMGTSSNFGNMFSAAGASLFLTFLPMTAPQILLNNLLYDVGEMTIPTDEVDPELLHRPSHWDMHFIRRFMLLFGPISSIFDFLTYGVMLVVFHAGPALFRSGWFVESLATQTLVIFLIRTRRVPFFRSRPSVPLLVTSLACVAVGAAVPFTPFGALLGFVPLPAAFFAILVAMIVVYLLLVEGAKAYFFRAPRRPRRRRELAPHARRIDRVASRWTRRARARRT
ncbi:MAG TPA: magnesium-translocating P-type ATPase [Candidatus Dormibacteraeota bacterium]|nr:magnesium-translocating P-type ATPase [Candidatus Dormibacteraeota bacterium]